MLSYRPKQIYFPSSYRQQVPSAEYFFFLTSRGALTQNMSITFVTKGQKKAGVCWQHSPLFDKEKHTCQPLCSRGLGGKIGNLSTDVFEPRTGTGSRKFSFLAWFLLLTMDRKTLVFMSAV